VLSGYRTVSVSKQILEDRQCFAIASRADGHTVAKYLEVAKESNLQTGGVLFGSFAELVWVCANDAEPGDNGIVWAA